MRFAAPLPLLLLGCAHPSPTSPTADDSGPLARCRPPHSRGRQREREVVVMKEGRCERLFDG